MTIDSVKKMKDALCEKLKVSFGSTVEEANDAQMMRASALVLRDVMAERSVDTMRETREEHRRQVHYLSMEFLMGRSLMKNAFNLGVGEILTEALDELGFRAADIFESEPDAGLGNGGLGRLAACYLDSMTTLDIPAAGYSICYELGIFRQRIVDGQQVELPDNWKDLGGAWLLPKPQETETVCFGGTVRQFWDDGRLHVVPEGETEVLAIPCDMEIAGYGTDHVNTLRLWDAKSPTPLDMSLFSQGEYLRAQEQHAMAETIAKVLYPEDNHPEGKSLRLKQQYFLVSATLQDICAKHKAKYGTLDNFAHKHVLHINDTHPTLVIPELMRILMDDNDMSWEQAWNITSQSVAYTNHTVMPEALECWPESLVQELMPRVMQIIHEINERFCKEAWQHFPSNWDKITGVSILSGGRVRMANLAVVGSHAINGVSKIHSEILVNSVFKDFYKMYPDRFTNVTNGIAHRRWLCYSNPELASLIEECIGDAYRHQPQRLEDFRKFENDESVLTRLAEIKHDNKVAFANHLRETTGQIVDPNSVFDVQIKRLHEYKRQLLNALNIINTYLDLRENPNLDIVPQTYLFGAKAAPGYEMAKQIIKLICLLGKEIESDPVIREKLRVVFLENYSVSMAEALIPAAEISEQISLAGKEASGTGCMKLMINGALTIGTLDGANIEMLAKSGKDNMFIFGLNCNEVDDLWTKGYHAADYYHRSAALRRTIDRLSKGFAGESFKNIADYLIAASGVADPYMCLADFESYKATHDRAISLYPNKKLWNKMSLNNIAGAGEFAADRSIEEYAKRIWHLNKVTLNK